MTLRRILIVDDDSQIQTMLRIGLESAGYETRQALTGHEAVRLAASIAPDAILLDLGLPDRDGKDVLQDIRAFSHLIWVQMTIWKSPLASVNCRPACAPPPAMPPGDGAR
jgi:DNA-binding response OmpR family regulator